MRLGTRARVPVKIASSIFLGVAGLTCDKSTGVEIGPPAAVEVVSGQDQRAVVGQELPAPLVARVLDAADRPISGRAVKFVVTSGGGALSPQDVLTDDDGAATTRWTLGTKTDPQRAEAQVLDPTTGEKLLSVEFRATAGAGGAAKLTKTSGDNQTAAAGTAVEIRPAVTVSDQYDNPLKDEQINWRIFGDPGTVADDDVATSKTDANGVAVLPGPWTLGQRVGTHTLTATLVSHEPLTYTATVTFTATAVVGPPARLGFVVPPSTTATNGERLPRQPVVQLQDQAGNPVKLADVVVQITRIPGSGPPPAEYFGDTTKLVILNDTTKTNSDGVATFTGTTLNGPVGDGYRLGFTAPMTSTLSSDPITLLRGQPYKLVILVPAQGATRGSTFAVQPMIQAEDAGGNPTTIAQCVNARISIGATLTGITQLSGVGDTFDFPNLGVSADTSPGTYTITYNTGCCVPDALLIPASQEIQVQ